MSNIEAYVHSLVVDSIDDIAKESRVPLQHILHMENERQLLVLQEFLPEFHTPPQPIRWGTRPRDITVVKNDVGTAELARETAS